MKMLKSSLRILTILCLALSAGCAGAPKIETCIIFVPGELDDDLERVYLVSDITAECTLPDGSQVTRRIDEMHEYVAIPKDDAITYIQYCQDKGK